MNVPKSCQGCPAAQRETLSFAGVEMDFFTCKERVWGEVHRIWMSRGVECHRRVKLELKKRRAKE